MHRISICFFLCFSLCLAFLPVSLFAADTAATPIDRIKILDGFEIELLYSVPVEEQGSWVAMCNEKNGRLIVSDQYGSLYRVTPPALGTTEGTVVEKIDLDIGHAWGLTYAFASLYVVLNDKAHGGRGLYRVRDTDGDDTYDKVELLKKFEEKGGEHGPHAVMLGPDGTSLYVVVGNQTALPGFDHSRVPPVWREDQLLPRIYGRGFMRGQLAPRGWIAKTDKDGKGWEIIATGFRNQYDAAFNRQGELFTYDADMEWDMNTPWYRPTRVNHVTSGAEFGWRNGSGKWPAYYPDSLGAVVDIGPGSPTGVAFGYGARFRSKYQEALYILDWSYGKLYAVHLEEDAAGASYTATFEEFLSAQPMPLTDIVVNPKDQAMYITIGGRKVQSGLYRVTDKQGVAPVPVVAAGDVAVSRGQQLRRRLESAHQAAPDKLPMILRHLGHADREIRYAARVALEHQPVAQWKDKALQLSEPEAVINVAIAVARQGVAADRTAVLKRLGGLDYNALAPMQRLALLRAYGLTFIRLGTPTEAEGATVIAHLDPHYPATSRDENIELAQVLAYLQAPSTAAKTVALLESAPTQEEQIALAKNIRLLFAGWTPELRERYFRWILRAKTLKGGNSFANFINHIRVDAMKQVPVAEKPAMQAILDTKIELDVPQFTAKPRNYVKPWKVADLEPQLAAGLKGGRDFANGRNLFGAGACFACHRFNHEGGAIGPDLSSVSGKFSATDLLDSIINPNKEISDQYGAMVMSKKDGSQVIGRIVNLKGDDYRVNTNMLAPNAITIVKRGEVVSIEPSKVSMMPPALLDTMTQDDILDLLAYLLSRGDDGHAMFK